ncbi:MAG: glycosyltransferase [Bacteroidaceae bacterium]|nr:glycosyltransferase [Bacteroidaceae bacterium]
MKLSIIIPVYNVEQYIGRCLQSCLSQPHVTPGEYELVIVNDGTKDNSMAIVEEMTRGCTNVTIINQQNQGLSMARNAGLKAAQGEYVWFIDSDDWIEDNCLHGIIERLERTKVDVLQLQYKNVYNDDIPNDEHYSIIKGIGNSKKWMVENTYFTAVQFMIYRREFLLQNNLQFYPGIYHEDSEFKPKVVYLADTCASYDKVVYNYFKGNANSITAVLKLKNGIDLFTVMNSLYTFVDNHKVNGIYRRSFYTQIGNAMKTVLRTLDTVSEEEAATLKQMMRDNRHLLRCMCKANNIRIQIGGLLMYTNLALGLKIYKLLS